MPLPTSFELHRVAGRANARTTIFRREIRNEAIFEANPNKMKLLHLTERTRLSSKIALPTPSSPTLHKIFRFPPYHMKGIMQILVVEDERRMADVLRQALVEEGYAVTVSMEGREGLSLAQTGGFDLIILDVMLPGLSGFEIVRQLRSKRNQTPMLMLTARDSTKDLVEGLDIGADDYLTKPFSFEVLLARVRAVSRRGPIPQPVCIEVAGLTMNPGTREVHRAGRPIDLTKTEYAILELLMRSAGRVVTRDTLIDRVWGGDSDIASNTLDAFIRLLRARIEEPGRARLIRTVRGVGYSLKSEGG
jgi:two-component system OmpR family response regulator